MKQFRNALWMAAPLAAMSFFSSCTKEEDKTMPVTAEEVQLANNEASMDALYQGIDNIILNNLSNSNQQGGRFLNNDCAVVERDATTLTIDYGQGCGTDHILKGKIIVNYEGSFPEEGFSQTATFEGFSIDGLEIEGTRSWMYQGFNNDDQSVSFAFDLEDGKVTWQDGSSATREGNGALKVIFAANDGNTQLQFTGEATGLRRDGQGYTSTISEPLTFSVGCEATIPQSGVQSIIREGKAAVVINYGEGECDNNATVTVGGSSQAITVE